MRNLMVLLIMFFSVVFSDIPVFAESFQGINYKVIEKSNLGNAKCTINILLEQKVSKDFLQKFANKLCQDESRKYDRMFITYYLPGMTIGTGAWATSHFNPNLEIEILGTTIEEEKSLRIEPQKKDIIIIGKWLDEAPYVSAKYTLIRKNEKVFMIQKFKDGSSSEKEMIQRSQAGRPRFEEKERNEYGEYYLIEKNGNLGCYDREGFIRTMPSMKKK